MKLGGLTRAQWWMLVDATYGVRVSRTSKPALRLVTLGLARFNKDVLTATEAGTNALSEISA